MKQKKCKKKKKKKKRERERERERESCINILISVFLLFLFFRHFDIFIVFVFQTFRYFYCFCFSDNYVPTFSKYHRLIIISPLNSAFQFSRYRSYKRSFRLSSDCRFVSNSQIEIKYGEYLTEPEQLW